MRNRILPGWAALFLSWTAVNGLSVAQDADPPGNAAVKKVDFARDVFPIFQARCVDCHGEDEQEGLLRMDAKAIVFAGGISGPSIKKGDADASSLMRRILGKDEKDRMPLDDDPLTDKETAIIRAWINQGAQWPQGVGSPILELPKHWSYVKPVRPAAPKVARGDWPRNAIDHFVSARLENLTLRPSPEAEPARLLRRVSLDLTGIPPKVEDVEAFLADPSPEAYERYVDRLLDSPRYGERWAQLWLDLARYADSNGYQADQFREVWPYRDWVIKAFNDDMPFNQFTLEQIAGDLLPGATVDQKIATGFHRLTTCNVEAGVDPEENRIEQIIDRVNTTGAVWLGTTVECGQCHDHKYDRFTQKDYYQLFAYFNNTPLEVQRPGGKGVQYNFIGPTMNLPLSAEKTARRDRLQSELDRANAALKRATATASANRAAWETSLVASRDKTPRWTTLDVAEFRSEEGASHRKLEDGSILVKGDNPDRDTYNVTVRADLKNVAAFKLEGLLDPSLPGGGPGRQTQRDRGNFIICEFNVSSRSAADSKPAGIEIAKAEADYANSQFPVKDALDGDPETGWSIHMEYHKPHHAVFHLAQPLNCEEGSELTFRIQQTFGGRRTLGRFRLSAHVGKLGGSGKPDAVAKLLAVPAEKRSKKQKQQIEEHYLNSIPEIKKLRGQAASVQKQLDGLKQTTTLVMVEMDKPRTNHVFKRGDFLNKGEPVQPGVPSALHPLPKDAPPNRIALGKWLADEENPLTARVTVNRWWAEFFGRGIVATVEDFGSQGEPSTHPKLLDWLAVEFMEGGWSMKRIHKLIVTSATYRQSSRVTPELLEQDPYNKSLTRAPRIRMSAETVRDNALAVAGLLSDKMGGPAIFPPQPSGVWRHVGRNAPVYRTSPGEDKYRRGVYVVWRRSAPYASFVNFDATDRAACTLNRPRTNTPLQALTLMNDPVYVEASLALAERMLTDRPERSVEQRLIYGFQRTLSRKPNTQELQFLTRLLTAELKRSKADPKAAKTLLTGHKIPPNVEPDELAAWFYVAHVLLNLDETITKG